MKIKRLSKGKTIAALSFAMIPSVASAGKMEPPEGDQLRQLSLQQLSNPFEAVMPPFNDEDFDFVSEDEEEGFFEGELDDYENIGIIFGETARHEMERGRPVTLSFVVSHIRNDIPVDVYLAYSTGVAPFAEGNEHPGLKLRHPPRTRQGGERPGPHAFDKHKPRPKDDAPEVPPVKAGQICVDFNKVSVIAAAHVDPIHQFMDAPTPFGEVQRNAHSVTFSINLSDLHVFAEKEALDVFFQAAVFPRDGLNRGEFGEAQVSECDHYFIEFDDPETPDYSEGEKFDDDAQFDTDFDYGDPAVEIIDPDK